MFFCPCGAKSICGGGTVRLPPQLYFSACRRKVISPLRGGYIRGKAAGYVFCPCGAKSKCVPRVAAHFYRWDALNQCFTHRYRGGTTPSKCARTAGTPKHFVPKRGQNISHARSAYFTAPKARFHTAVRVAPPYFTAALPQGSAAKAATGAAKAPPAAAIFA